MVTVSIIIPTKNSEKTLPTLFKSLKKQSFKDFEVLVIDGFSRDKTVSIAKDNGARVYTVEGERSVQKNFGALKAKGKYLYFIDSDFYLHSKTLEECVNIVERNHDAVVVLNISDPRPSTVAKIRFFERLSYYMSNIYEAARFIKKEAFFKAGAAAYIGSTEPAPAGVNEEFAKKLFRDYFRLDRTIGEALTDFKRDKVERCSRIERIGSPVVWDYWSLVVYEYNLYGDPKLGAR